MVVVMISLFLICSQILKATYIEHAAMTEGFKVQKVVWCTAILAKYNAIKLMNSLSKHVDGRA
jgi:hypothetical protein